MGNLKEGCSDLASLIFQKAADGDVKAQCAMALLFELGIDRPADYAKAFEWWQKAALAGDGRAMAKLAEFYGTGKGVKKDGQLASEWAKKAEALGFGIGMKYVREQRRFKEVSKGKKVLILTTDRDLSNELAVFCEESGLSPLCFFSVEEAIETFKKTTGVIAVFSDLKVDRFSGFNIVSSLKLVEAAHGVSYVMLSETVTTEKIMEGDRVGISGWLIKPVVFSNFNNIIKNIA